MTRCEKAVAKYKSGYSCSQAIACAYADVMEMEETIAYRLSEGFGGGMGHYGHTCGACSAMVLVASYHVCPGMKNIGNSKENTYPIVKGMVERFEKFNGNLNCFDILKDAPKGLEDGKRLSCIRCVECACQQLDELIKDK